ncbi:hypothetical protein GCM10027566_37390 [Arachidicoccus ginsenosidivorans]
MFYRTQEALDGRLRKPTYTPKVVSDELLPLRGFLACLKCGDNLTGSASKGRSQYYYYYYHCKPSCGFREKAEVVNEAFYKELEKYTPQPAVAELYKKIVLTSTTTYNQDLNKRIKEISDQIEEQNMMVQKARSLMLHDKIDPDEYKEIKREAEGKITALESRVANFNATVKDISSILNNAIDALIKIGEFFKTNNLETKRAIIGSIFDEKLFFENGTYRTAKVNEATGLIFLIINKLQDKKNWTGAEFSRLSNRVNLTGFEPVTFTMSR